MSLGADATTPDEQYLKNAVHKMFMELDLDENKDARRGVIESIRDHINALAEGDRSEHQKLFLTTLGQYGSEDIGLLFIFFLNILTPAVGQSFVCYPDEPHAYIQGELMEAMVNSDNVVRGGLTPKYKDKETLTEMMKYEFKAVQPNNAVTVLDNEGMHIGQHKTGYEEFTVYE